MAECTTINWDTVTGDYTGSTPEWGTHAGASVAHQTAISDCFSNLVACINGTLSAANFSTLIEAFYQDDESNNPLWSRAAIKEHKINFDPYEGHDHALGGRDTWDDHKIVKKNLDPQTARVVWTNLEGMPANQPAHGTTVIGGVYTIDMYIDSAGVYNLVDGYVPDATNTTMYSTGWISMCDATKINFVKWTSSWYWKNTNYTTTAGFTDADYRTLSPFLPGCMPVVVANLLIPSMAGRFAPVWSRWGNVVFQPQRLDSNRGNVNFGFWFWWTNFEPNTAVASMSTNSLITFAVPWLAFGPGGHAWV